MSEIRQLLVHLDPTRSAGSRLALACQLAARFGAALTGLYAATPAFAAVPYAPAVGPGLTPALAEVDDKRRQQARTRFEQATRGLAAPTEWAQTSQVPVSAAFAQQALYADLLVLGQRDPSDEDASTVPGDFVPSVLIASGRPGLVVPHIGVNGPVGETIAIAWKDTPEAARAVTAALPFLQRARRVHVLSWGEEEEPAVGGRQLDLESYLAAHGVQFARERSGAERHIGEQLLSRAFDLQADLLVMGCYGHSRAREWILGGASRTVLQSMTLPVLMMH